MRPPVIALSGRQKRGREIPGFPTAVDNVVVELYIADYANAVLAAGGLPVYLPLDVDPADVVGFADGILLSGGTDLAPDLYGGTPDPEALDPEPDRDQFEVALLAAAGTHHTPVLGICRGLQVINVAHGGTLHQHVEAHAGFDLAPETELHDVNLVAGTALHDMYGSRRAVNSLHHQTVDAVGAGLTVAARSDDGTVEGLQHPELPVLAVQWHPEMMTSAATDPLFRWLVDTARRGANGLNDR